MKQFADWPELMTIPDVIDCTGMTGKDVYRAFKQPGFPQLVPGKKADRRVGKYALREWINRGAKI